MASDATFIDGAMTQDEGPVVTRTSRNISRRVSSTTKKKSL
jgi:hypothetical protein